MTTPHGCILFSPRTPNVKVFLFDNKISRFYILLHHSDNKFTKYQVFFLPKNFFLKSATSSYGLSPFPDTRPTCISTVQASQITHGCQNEKPPVADHTAEAAKVAGITERQTGRSQRGNAWFSAQATAIPTAPHGREAPRAKASVFPHSLKEDSFHSDAAMYFIKRPPFTRRPFSYPAKSDRSPYSSRKPSEQTIPTNRAIVRQ